MEERNIRRKGISKDENQSRDVEKKKKQGGRRAGRNS